MASSYNDQRGFSGGDLPTQLWCCSCPESQGTGECCRTTPGPSQASHGGKCDLNTSLYGRYIKLWLRSITVLCEYKPWQDLKGRAQEISCPTSAFFWWSGIQLCKWDEGIKHFPLLRDPLLLSTGFISISVSGKPLPPFRPLVPPPPSPAGAGRGRWRALLDGAKTRRGCSQGCKRLTLAEEQANAALDGWLACLTLLLFSWETCFSPLIPLVPQLAPLEKGRQHRSTSPEQSVDQHPFTAHFCSAQPLPGADWTCMSTIEFLGFPRRPWARASRGHCEKRDTRESVQGSLVGTSSVCVPFLIGSI